MQIHVSSRCIYRPTFGAERKYNFPQYPPQVRQQFLLPGLD